MERDEQALYFWARSKPLSCTPTGTSRRASADSRRPRRWGEMVASEFSYALLDASSIIRSIFSPSTSGRSASFILIERTRSSSKP